MSENGKPSLVTAKDGHTYHKSSTANATVAPTNQATLDKLEQKHLTPDQIQFVTIADMEFNLGNFNDEYLISEYGYSTGELNSFYASDSVCTALLERGIDLSKLRAPTERHAKLSPIQLIVANRLLDLTDNRSDKKKLQDSGVTSLQYTAWLADPEFTGYMQQRAEALLGSSQHEILLALMDKVKARDTSAIKLALEVTGRHVSQTSANNGSGTSTHDISSIITRVVEIIIDEVEDQNTAMRIAERIQGLVIGGQVAGTIPMQEQIQKPEIAAPRELTAEVQAMMDKGLGYDN
jgi:hypothetical protein